MGRFGTYTHDASIDIDIDDVIAEIDDAELAAELDRRKKTKSPATTPFDVLFDVATAFHDTHHVGIPFSACPNILCCDAAAVLAAKRKVEGGV